MSSEYFLPNIQLLEINSITLLETNQKFIEAYMVGLNHEFARELLWREYPTDQRGSYFRQFWDVSGFLAAPGADPAALRERLRDIPELHTWSTDTGLGEHDNREAQGDKEDELVLVDPRRAAEEVPDRRRLRAPRRVAARPDGGDRQVQAAPARGRCPTRRPTRRATLVKTPLYEAKVDPDIYFFGFDLTAEAARGGADRRRRGGPGLVLRHQGASRRAPLRARPAARPPPQPPSHTWNELAWTDVVDGYARRGAPAVGRSATRGARRPGRRHDARSRSTTRTPLPLAGRHARRRARLHPLPGARADGRARRRDAQERRR